MEQDEILPDGPKKTTVTKEASASFSFSPTKLSGFLLTVLAAVAGYFVFLSVFGRG